MESKQEIKRMADDFVHEMFVTRKITKRPFQDFFMLFEKYKMHIIDMPEFKNWVTILVTLIENDNLQYKECTVESINLVISECHIDVTTHEIQGVELETKIDSLNKLIYQYTLITKITGYGDGGPALSANRKVGPWSESTTEH